MAPALQPPHRQEPAADTAAAVAAALVAPGTLLMEAAQVQARPTSPGDGARSHPPCRAECLPWGTPQCWGTHLWGTALRPPGLPASTHLQGRPRRHGHSRCWCTSAPGGTAGRWHTPARTARGLRPGSLWAQPPAVTPSWLQGRCVAAQQAECSLLPPGTATATHTQAQPELQHFSSRRQALSSRHWLLCLCRGSPHGSARGHSPGCSAGGGQGEGSPPGSRAAHAAAPCPVPGAEPGAAGGYPWQGACSAWRSRRSSISPAGDSPCRGHRRPPLCTAPVPAVASPLGTGRVCLKERWEGGSGATGSSPMGSGLGCRCPGPVGPLRWPQPRAPCPEEVRGGPRLPACCRGWAEPGPHTRPRGRPLTSFRSQADPATSAAAAALLVPWALPVLCTGGLARGPGPRCRLGQGADPRLLCKAGGSAAGGAWGP